MATEEDISKLDKQVVISTPCLPCSEVGTETDAIRYCVECKSHFCEECLHHHNRFVALRKHQIVEKSDAAKHLGDTEQTRRNLQVECGSHYGQHIVSYCKNHNELCCDVCVSINHRFCQIEEILKMAEGIKESKEFSDIKQSLEKFLVFANQEKTDRNKNLTDLEEEKIQILEDIDKAEENLIERIRTTAETSREKVRVTQAKHVNAVKADVKELDTVMCGLKKCINKLNEAEANETEALIGAKKCQKTLSELEVVVKQLSNKWQQTEIYFKFKDVVLHKDINIFGDVIEESKTDEEYRLTCKQDVNIRQKTDNKTCKIKGICQLADGTFVIIDSNNDNMKRMSENLEVTDTINLDGKPESTCVTGPNEVAITLPEKSLVQFVKIDERLSLDSSFSTAPGRCTVINYDSTEEKVYVCCAYVKDYHKFQKIYSTISVYDKKGTLLTTFDKDGRGQTDLREPHQIFLGTGVVRVINKDLRVVVLKKTDEGQLEYTSQSNYSSDLFTSIQEPERAQVLLSEDVMLCCTASGKMSLITVEARPLKNLLMEKLSREPTAFFNQKTSTLLVAGESCEIREYKMPLKILKLLK